MVICLERGADLHMAQLMPLPLTVSCFSKLQIGFTFLVPAHPGSPGKRAVKWYVWYVCVFVHVMTLVTALFIADKFQTVFAHVGHILYYTDTHFFKCYHVKNYTVGI